MSCDPPNQGQKWDPFLCFIAKARAPGPCSIARIAMLPKRLAGPVSRSHGTSARKAFLAATTIAAAL